MKVSVDQEACVSSGQCVMTATGLFDQRDSDGVVILLVANPGPGEAGDALRAAAACPALAIDIEE